MTVELITGKQIERLGCGFTEPWNIGPFGRIPQRSARPSIKLVWTCTVFESIMCLFKHRQVCLLRATPCAVERRIWLRIYFFTWTVAAAPFGRRQTVILLRSASVSGKASFVAVSSLRLAYTVLFIANWTYIENRKYFVSIRIMMEII